VWAGLWIVYIVWGSTYLAIRLMVRTIPPLMAGGVRFFVAGTLMCGLIAAKRGTGALRLTRPQLAACLLLGALLPAAGNGLVTVAEKHVPSSLAALIISSVPLWVVVFRFLDGERPGTGTLIGVGVGFVGVATLLLPGRPEGVHLIGVITVLIAALAWASGSFLTPRVKTPGNVLVTVAWEMVFGGAFLLIASVAAGESVDLGGLSAESVGGLVYLIFIGSMVAYTAYGWLLGNAPISRVATYAYVNPVVAVFLGWAVLSEDITALTLAAAAVIVASVAGIVRHETPGAPTEAHLESGDRLLDRSLTLEQLERRADGVVSVEHGE
jgi:drug/metabolite transporter (DMT)-like permease